MDRVANTLAHTITANTMAVQEDHARRDNIAAERIEIIPNAVQADRFAPNTALRQSMRSALNVADNDVVIFCVGNLIPYKGHADLIAALGMLPCDLPRYKLFLAGRHESLGDQLIAQAQHTQVDFTLLGSRDDVPALLQAADLFVLPSHEEGSSNALLEAVISGTPALATSVGGNSELLLDGAGGWLCDARAPKKLADVLEEALRNPADARARSQKARRAALAGRDVAALVRSHMQLYDRVAPLAPIS